jgi:hypothetical protein
MSAKSSYNIIDSNTMQYKTVASQEPVLHPLRLLCLAYLFCCISCVVFHDADGDHLDIKTSKDLIRHKKTRWWLTST